MKSLAESINTNINEAREVEYQVTFVGFNNNEDSLPTTVKILVQREHARAFDNFLENERDNIFRHAEGSSVEY
jgi:hypothetical protein